MSNNKLSSSPNQPETKPSGSRKSLPQRWEFNRRLAGISLALTTSAVVLGFLLYNRASNHLALSLREKAEQASEAGDWEGKIKWLRRYLKLAPDSDGTVIDIAIAANNAVALPPANRFDRVERARNSLNNAIAVALSSETPDLRTQELQRFLILRLSQYGVRYAPEIIDKIIDLNPPADDPWMLRTFAIAASRTENQITKEEKSENTVASDTANKWTKLLQLPIPQLLWKTWNTDPSDTQVASLLLEKLRTLPAKASTTKNDTEFDPEAVLISIVADLDTRPTNARAQWALFTHQSVTAPETAKQRLASQFKERMSRLKQAQETLDKDLAESDVDSPGSDSGSTPVPVLPPAEGMKDISTQLDYAMAVVSILEGGGPSTGSTPTGGLRTLKNLRNLCTYSELDVYPQAITNSFISYCNLLIAADESVKVLDAFAEGIERLGEESSQLQLNKISYLLNSGKLEQTAASIRELEALQRRRAEIFTGALKTLTQKQRLAYRTELDTTSWNLLLHRGLLALQRDQVDQAIRKLNLALESQTQIASPARVSAAANLGQAYSRKQLWDLAAIAFEKAVELTEDGDQYRMMAATAWNKCGNAEREMRILNSLKRRSPGLSIRALRSSIRSELTKVPSDRNFAPIQNRTDEIRSQLNSLEDTNTNKRTLLCELELIALSIPEREDGDEKEAASERVLTLTEKYPENLEILRTAALTMAVSGDSATAVKLLKKLGATLGVDSYRYVAIAARIASLSGNHAAAAESLQEFAELHPNMATDALTLASQIMINQGEREAALDFLLAIPKEQQTIMSLYKSFELSLVIETDTRDEVGKYKPQVLLKRLQAMEGADGTFWRLAEATMAVANSQNAEKTSEQKLELLAAASNLYEEIDARRPRWSYNSTLGGWIAAVRGNTGAAIPLLRRAISTGDKRMSTLLMLVAQLNTANRVSEAEKELSRLGQLVTANSASTLLAVSIAGRGGDYERGMKLARQNAGSNPRGKESWMLLAQTAMLAARAGADKKTKDILLAEAKSALDNALVITSESDLSVFRLRCQYQATFFDTAGVRRELNRTLKSKVPEPSKSLFVGRVYLQLNDPSLALKVFERLRTLTPNSPDVYLGLAEYYRYKRDDAKNIQMLEVALTNGPSRADVRSRLALGLALRQSGEIPWERISNLVGGQEDSAPSNELLHALILINKGDDLQKQKAADILTQLRQSPQAGVDDATRMLAGLETQRWLSCKEKDSLQEAEIHLARAREMYTDLTRRPNASAMDLYKFGDLLLRANQTTELTTIADQLDRIATGATISLDLRLRLAKKLGNEQEAERLAEEWAYRAIASGTLLNSNVWGSVGQTLTKLGFHDEALEWLAKAYEADHRFFRDYAVGLTRNQRFLIATDICKTEFKNTSNPEALALMIDITVLAGEDTTFPEENEQLMLAALSENQSVPRVIESIATLRLSQQRYVEAVRLYEQAEKLAPKNVRILNNLSMALSEIPGRENQAIPKIESAIEIFGRSPELLDTQGLVLLRNNLPAEAAAVLREVTKASDDPRYRFHLIMALLRIGDKKAAISNWARLNIKQLRQLPLTPGELADLDSLQKEF